MKLRNVLLGLTATIAMYSCSGNSLPTQTAATPVTVEKAAIPAIFASTAIVPGKNIDLSATSGVLDVNAKTLTIVGGTSTTILGNLINSADGGKVYYSVTGKGSVSSAIVNDNTPITYTAPAVGEFSRINIFFLDGGNTNVVMIDVTSTTAASPANVPPQINVFTATPAVGTATLATTFAMNVSDATVPADTLTCTLSYGDATPNYGPGPCLASLNHTYAAPGTYVATLSVSDGVNAPVTKTVTVVVNAALKVDSFTATTTPPTFNVATSYAFSGGTAPYTCVINWDTTNAVDLTVYPGFQKMQTISPCAPTALLNKTYPFGGKFIANIKVTDSLGAMDNKDVTINMNGTNNNPFIQIFTALPTPIILDSAFANDPADVSNPFATLIYTAQNVTVTTKATDVDPGDLLTCKVNSVVIPTCDNNTMTLPITAPGSQSVVFDVADNFGGTATATLPVVATAKPAGLVTATNLGSKKARIYVNAADGDGDNLACQVNYGDATVLNIAACQNSMPGSFVHTYAAAGAYTITWKVFDGTTTITKTTSVTVTL
jgi:hypothetical protein